MMKRDEALKIIDEQRGGAIIVAHYQAAFDLIRIAPNPLNYYYIGAMGQGSSHGLGLALGVSERKVIVLDGDGSLLMNLGSLATIVAAAPPNFIHFVLENGCYETNGSHPLPANGQFDFAAVARGAGIRHVFEIDSLDRLRTDLPAILGTTGPVFVSLKVTAGEKSPEPWPYINNPASRRAFVDALRQIRER